VSTISVPRAMPSVVSISDRAHAVVAHAAAATSQISVRLRSAPGLQLVPALLVVDDRHLEGVVDLGAGCPLRTPPRSRRR